MAISVLHTPEPATSSQDIQNEFTGRAWNPPVFQPLEKLDETTAAK
jgi:hypothetical protein